MRAIALHRRRRCRCEAAACEALPDGCTCAKECAPLASYEWLANVHAGQWATKDGQLIKPGVRIYAGAATWLKKSTEVSGGLPADQKLQ